MRTTSLRGRLPCVHRATLREAFETEHDEGERGELIPRESSRIDARRFADKLVCEAKDPVADEVDVEELTTQRGPSAQRVSSTPA